MNLENVFINKQLIQLDTFYINKYFKLYKDFILIQEGITNKNINLNESINLDSLYYIEIENINIEILKYKLYDTKEFNELYNTDETLGCIINDNDITIRVFAPTKFSINLNIYETGDTTNLTKSIPMKKNKGIFEISINKSYENFYYTYCVFDNINKNNFNEVCDPYAKTTGVNGLRAMITNLKSTGTITSPYPKRTFNEAIVYELHVRDLSMDESYSGKYKGKFLGLIEENTTYTKNNITIKTGFDHIKELGVTDVQLLPIFDYSMVDETRINDKSYHNINNGIYNWGYMGLNFNTLEGSYSTNPYDGLVRVKDFKKVVEKYNQNNIGIIMDVVYNHTAFDITSNFHILVPCYYHRMNDTKFSNASACGNETASERYMVRRFIVESIVFLAKEYHLSGFRFDLMQIHDVETMNCITKELAKIDESILVYGEPWTGGPSTLDPNLQAGKINLHKMNVGAFNDEIRDGIRGSVFNFDKGAYIQGVVTNKIFQQVKYGIVGGTKHPQIDESYLPNGFWHTSSNQCVNYVSAHDNHTIWDKLTLSTNTSIEERKEMVKQANGIIFLSKGLAFIHAGAELCRSKPTLDNKLEDNSYNCSDYTNKIRWENKIDFYDVFLFYKELINFRKNNNLFYIDSNIEFIDLNSNCISYKINNTYFIIINNFNETLITLDKDYKIIMQNNLFINNKMALKGDYLLNKNSINIFKL
ncbi:MAG: type I pullulanase [bacterium]